MEFPSSEQNHFGYMWTGQIEFLRKKHEECQELTYIWSQIELDVVLKNMYELTAFWNTLSHGQVDSKALQCSSFLFWRKVYRNVITFYVKWYPVSRITTLLRAKRSFHWIPMKSRLARAAKIISKWQNITFK